VKHFVYRPLVLASLALGTGLAPALFPSPLAAQTALTVGSVRDVRGTAIAGATVEGYAGAGDRVG
jgi:hypothetical protein